MDGIHGRRACSKAGVGYNVRVGVAVPSDIAEFDMSTVDVMIELHVGCQQRTR